MKIFKIVLCISLISQLTYSQNNIIEKSRYEFPAEYPGGVNEMYNIIYKSQDFLKVVTDKKTHGKLIILLSINSKGKIIKARILKSLGKDIDKAVIKAVSELKSFIPAHTKNISSNLEIPIYFMEGEL